MIILKKETELAATQPLCNLHETYVLIMLIKKDLYPIIVLATQISLKPS
jgi:hypothetical protein